MAKQKQMQEAQQDNGQTFTDSSAPARTPFVEGVANTPAAAAAATPSIADVVATRNDALSSASDVIAAFYEGKRMGALELCAHLENNWGSECRLAATDWRAKLAGLPS